MRGLAAAGQLLGQRHLVEVEGRVQAALAHLQLVAQGVDALLGCKEGHTGGKKEDWFKAGASTQTHSGANVSNLDKVAGQHFEILKNLPPERAVNLLIWAQMSFASALDMEQN